MRKIILLILIAYCFGCTSSTNKKPTTLVSEEKLNTKKFFDYDEIDYYLITPDANFDDSDIYRPKSKIDYLRIAVLQGYTPKNISDSAFISELEAIGYIKKSINKSMFGALDEIFIEMPDTTIWRTKCISTYRDLLIFKKKQRVIGCAKICFECADYQIRGTNANTEYFGQNGGYKKLEKLLRGYNDPLFCN